MTKEEWQTPKYQIFEFKKKLTKYCICIPVINEGEKFKKQLVKMRRVTNLADVLVLDGGSTDGTNNINLLKRNRVRALLIKEGSGRYSAQLRMGYKYALKQKYKGIIQMDGNNKDGIDGVIRFIKELDNGFDYIQGSRFLKGGKSINTPPLRWVGIRLIFSPLLSLASRFWFTDITNGFRAYSDKLLLHPNVKPFRKIFAKYELLFYLPVRAAQIGLKVKEIPVTRKYPTDRVPTKITGLINHLDILMTVIKTALNFYKPIS